MSSPKHKSMYERVCESSDSKNGEVQLSLDKTSSVARTACTRNASVEAHSRSLQSLTFLELGVIQEVVESDKQEAPSITSHKENDLKLEQDTRKFMALVGLGRESNYQIDEDFLMSTRTRVWSCIEQLQRYGVLGPCTYDDCKNYATNRCNWRRECSMSSGGCHEQFCQDHSYIPQGASQPQSCQDCSQYYQYDMKLGQILKMVSVCILLLICACGVA